MGLALARFARLEDPSGSLFDFLKNLKETLHEKGQPSLFDEKGISLNDRNEYDFLEELILSGQMSEEQFKLVENLRGLRAWEESSGSDKNAFLERHRIKSILKAKINQEFINENTQERAMLTNKGLGKMLSDRAIQKSVDNGFSREEHLRAVEQIESLFIEAKKAFSKIDEKDKNLIIHRYNAPFENANALLTVKEYKLNGKKIYSLELENLEAVKFNPSGKDLTEQLSKSKDADTTNLHTPIDNPSESIAQNTTALHSNQHLGAGLAGGTLNGFSEDENGNLSFNPQDFLKGFIYGAGGSLALKKGLKFVKDNPDLKEAVKNEVKRTLEQGFEKAVKKYPFLEPRLMMMQGGRGLFDDDIAYQAAVQRAKNEKQGFVGKNLFDILEEEAENHAQKIKELKFTDENGKEHILSKEAQEAWMEAFNLNN